MTPHSQVYDRVCWNYKMAINYHRRLMPLEAGSGPVAFAKKPLAGLPRPSRRGRLVRCKDTSALCTPGIHSRSSSVLGHYHQQYRAFWGRGRGATRASLSRGSISNRGDESWARKVSIAHRSEERVGLCASCGLWTSRMMRRAAVKEALGLRYRS
jgi:hypothetical protein